MGQFRQNLAVRTMSGLTPASGMTADIPDQQLRAMRYQREADADEDDSTPAATPASMGPPACSGAIT